MTEWIKRAIQRTLCLIALALGVSLPALAQLSGTITEGSVAKRPIAVPSLTATSEEARELGRQIAEVVQSDLESSGLFDIVPEAAHLQRDLNVQVQPRWADWRVIKTDYLVAGEAEILSDGRLRVAFRLWDINNQRFLDLDGQSGRQYVQTPENWRRFAHKIADEVYSRLTGETGYFDTRIVFIAESGPKIDRKKRLAIMDQDGANPEFLTSGVDRVLTPRFSPTDQVITYMSYENGRPQVYLFNIQSGLQESLGNFEGMTFAPRFSPDGNSVIMSQAINGNSDVYVMDLRRRTTKRLTTHQAIDTSPSFAPGGEEIVFNSDRGGSPQLYVMNADESTRLCPSGERALVCRISFESGRYSTPVWSPRGDLIAFTKQLRGRFYIGVMKPDGTGERLLTESYLDEGPSWSPNGRFIIFFREDRPGASPSIWTVDLTGRNLRRLNTPGDASDPAWGPLLQ